MTERILMMVDAVLSVLDRFIKNGFIE